MTEIFRSSGNDPLPYQGIGGQTFDQPDTIIGSGVYFAERLFQAYTYQPPIEITGPCVTPWTTLQPQKHESGPSIDVFVSEMKTCPNVFPVPQGTLSNYAQTIVQVARTIKERHYDVILCPLRGARHAGLQANIICKDEPFTPFDGAHLAQGKNDARILDDLRRIITGLPAFTENLRLCVLDTAKGGDSCREFARLLSVLNRELYRKWTVDFHLIHSAEKFPRRSWEAKEFESDTLTIELRHYEVTHLIVEDEVRVLGYELANDGSGTRIVRVSQVGQIMVYSSTEAKVFKEAPFDEMMVAILAAEVADDLQSIPGVTPVSLD